MTKAFIDDFLRCKQLEKQLATVIRALADTQERLDIATANLELWRNRNEAAAHVCTGEDDERG